MPDAKSGRWQRFYAVIRRIPEGRVATYGQVAELAGLPRSARQVGYALAALAEESDLPWQRVINARGEVSLRREMGRDGYQRHLLEEEGVLFSIEARVDLKRFGWKPRFRAPAPKSDSKSDAKPSAKAGSSSRARKSAR
ncbi:MAG: MGMT family protein [Thermoanaerobaculia bacterium]